MRTKLRDFDDMKPDRVGTHAAEVEQETKALNLSSSEYEFIGQSETKIKPELTRDR